MRLSISLSRRPSAGRKPWRRACRLIGFWLERRRQRRALGELDARLLDDIGVTPAEAARERDKPFWRGGGTFD